MCSNERSLVALPALPDRGMSWVVGHLAPSSKASREAVANVDADCDISAGMVGINVARQRKAVVAAKTRCSRRIANAPRRMPYLDMVVDGAAI